jgi:trehalose 6-phosphate synthase
VAPEPLATAKSIPEAREDVDPPESPRGHKLGVGIERLDYTKGIIERFNAVERLFEIHPQWVGRFTFVQIPRPPPTLGEYRVHAERVEERAREINARFLRGRATADYPARGTSRAERGLRVSSGGRFLLREQPSRRHEFFAKEFVAAREDEQGC